MSPLELAKSKQDTRFGHYVWSLNSEVSTLTLAKSEKCKCPETFYDIAFHTRETIFPVNQVTMSAGRKPWHHGTMALWHHGTIVPWNHCTMEPWSHCTMAPWHHGMMAPWHKRTSRNVKQI